MQIYFFNIYRGTVPSTLTSVFTMSADYNRLAVNSVILTNTSTVPVNCTVYVVPNGQAPPAQGFPLTLYCRAAYYVNGVLRPVVKQWQGLMDLVTVGDSVWVQGSGGSLDIGSGYEK